MHPTFHLPACALALLALPSAPPGAPAQDAPRDPRPEREASGSAFERLVLVHASAEELAAVLSATLAPDVTVRADARANALLVSAPADAMQALRAAVERLDGAPAMASAGALPQASEDMVIAVDEQGDSWTMMDVVRDYGRLTGQHVQMDSDTRGELEATSTGLARSAVVPAAEVPSFVEHLLGQNRFMLDVLREEEPRLVSVYSLQSGNWSQMLRSTARFVPEDELERWTARPTALVTTVVPVPHLDARQLAGMMRSMIVDQRTQLVLPAGEANALVLTGFAPYVTELARVLHAADEAARAESGRTDFQRFPLAHASAEEIAGAVQDLVTRSLATPSDGQAPPGGRIAGARVVADPRTNALVVMAGTHEMPHVRRVVELLDLPAD